MSKNIVVFSDGTNQEGGEGSPTNIYKIYRMLENRTPDQISFYDRGLGTGWRKLSGNALGSGISKNIKECYQFIFDDFESGDQIFLFGFSRGAATVRSLSGFIHLFGLLPKSRPELIDQAWKIYKVKDRVSREEKAKNFLSKHHNMWARIKFLGVFDTVAALGVPSKFISRAMDRIPSMKHKFHNFDLSESVENAYQALSIDDERKTFHPLIWNPRIRNYQNMEQVWFSGVHTDVGGGYPEQGLSDISLEWMLAKAQANGLKIFPNHNVKIAPDVNGTMHDPFGGLMPWRRKERFWDSKIHSKPQVHNSVFNRSLDKQNKSNSNYEPWIVQIPHDVV
jgi:uncharacterized protein (DUF2235 family)